MYRDDLGACHARHPIGPTVDSVCFSRIVLWKFFLSAFPSSLLFIDVVSTRIFVHRTFNNRPVTWHRGNIDNLPVQIFMRVPCKFWCVYLRAIAVVKYRLVTTYNYSTQRCALCSVARRNAIAYMCLSLGVPILFLYPMALEEMPRCGLVPVPD